MEEVHVTWERVADIWNNIQEKDAVVESFGFDDEDFDFLRFVAGTMDQFRDVAMMLYFHAIVAKEPDVDILDASARAEVMATADLMVVSMMFARERARLEG